MSKEERNKRQREYRAANNNLHTKAYEKTKKGFLMRVYRNMQSRVTGVQSKKKHLYENKELLSREEFYEWSESNPVFHLLWAVWENEEHSRRLTPSIDRKDTSKGYELSNMQWLTHSENSRLGALGRRSK